MSVFYHVFDWSQDKDEYFNTPEEAETYFNDLKKQGCRNLRIYENTEDPEGHFIEECIQSYEAEGL